MMDAIARSGSFAAAARELGKVPSALTYNVRQLEDALDVLLFDRRSRQATLTPAGQELLDEGRRLLEQMDAVANRVKRVATGWETQLGDRGRRRRLALDRSSTCAPTSMPSARSGPRRQRGHRGRDAERGRAAPARAAADAAAPAHRSDGRHLGSARHRPGRPRDRRRPRARAAERRRDQGARHRSSSCFAVAPHHPLAAVKRRRSTMPS